MRTPAYKEAAPFAKMTLESINWRPIRTHPTVKPVPYVGIQFVAIPEFAGIGTEVSQEFSAALCRPAVRGRSIGKSAGFDQRRHGSRRLPLSLSS